MQSVRYMRVEKRIPPETSFSTGGTYGDQTLTTREVEVWMRVAEGERKSRNRKTSVHLRMDCQSSPEAHPREARRERSHGRHRNRDSPGNYPDLTDRAEAPQSHEVQSGENIRGLKPVGKCLRHPCDVKSLALIGNASA